MGILNGLLLLFFPFFNKVGCSEIFLSNLAHACCRIESCERGDNLIRVYHFSTFNGLQQAR